MNSEFEVLKIYCVKKDLLPIIENEFHLNDQLRQDHEKEVSRISNFFNTVISYECRQDDGTVIRTMFNNKGEKVCQISFNYENIDYIDYENKCFKSDYDDTDTINASIEYMANYCITQEEFFEHHVEDFIYARFLESCKNNLKNIKTYYVE